MAVGRPRGRPICAERGRGHSVRQCRHQRARNRWRPAPDIEIYNDRSTEASPGGGKSSVTFNTAGSILVDGALDYVDAGASDALTLNAGKQIEVITDAGGSIAMTDNLGDAFGNSEPHGA